MNLAGIQMISEHIVITRLKKIVQEQQTMTSFKLTPITGMLMALLWVFAGPAEATYFVQCPGDNDGSGDAIIDGATDPTNPLYPGGVYSYPDNTRCMHVTASDGYVKLNGREDPYYFFSYHDRLYVCYNFIVHRIFGISPKSIFIFEN